MKIKKSIILVVLAITPTLSLADSIKSRQLIKIAHTERAFNNGIEEHNYTFHLRNGNKPKMQISINPNQHLRKDIVFKRILTPEEIVSQPHFLSGLQDKANQLSKRYNKGKIKIISTQGKGINYQAYGIPGDQIQAKMDKLIEEQSIETSRDIFHAAYNAKTKSHYPDYRYAAIEQRSLTKSLAIKLLKATKTLSAKEKIAIITRFVQDIPYDSANMSDANFRTPIAVIDDYKGDCDEKSLLLAMLFKEIFPSLEHGVLTIDTRPVGHAVTYIEYPFASNLTISIGNKKYLLIETTTPSSIGKIDKKSLRAINSGKYTKISI